MFGDCAEPTCSLVIAAASPRWRRSREVVAGMKGDFGSWDGRDLSLDVTPAGVYLSRRLASDFRARSSDGLTGSDVPTQWSPCGHPLEAPPGDRTITQNVGRRGPASTRAVTPNPNLS